MWKIKLQARCKTVGWGARSSAAKKNDKISSERKRKSKGASEREREDGTGRRAEDFYRLLFAR